MSYSKRGNEKCKQARTEASPHFAVSIVNLEDGLQELYGLMKLLSRPEDQTNGIHRWDGLWVRAQCVFICAHGIVEAAKKFGETAYTRDEVSELFSRRAQSRTGLPICIHRCSLTVLM